MKRIALLCVLLSARAAGACMAHPNLIFCAEAQEGVGLTFRDTSPSGLTSTLIGGPAWARAGRPQAFGHTVSSMTTVDMGVNALSFPGTIGIETQTPNTTLFDFSGNLPYVIAFSFQATGFPLADNKTIFAFTDGSTASGWSIHMQLDGGIVVAHVGAANSGATAQVRDNNNHRFLVARNGPSIFEYLDGQFLRSQTGFGDMSSPGTGLPLGFARASISAAGVWNGKANNAAIYNVAIFPNRTFMDAFAKAEYLYWQGGGE